MNQIRLICFHWTRYAIRGGAGLTFLLVALLFALSVAHYVVAPVEMAMSRSAKQGTKLDSESAVDEVMKMGRPIVEWALGKKLFAMDNGEDADRAGEVSRPASAGQAEARVEKWAVYLLDEHPALLSLTYLVLIFGLPFLIPVVGFNQLSGDVQSRGLRYLLTRTDRRSIYTGRFLGTVLFAAAVMAFLVAIITFYVAVKIRIYPVGSLLLWGAHGFLALAILSIPYVGLCSLVSAQVDSPFLSLVLSKLVILGIPVLAFVGRYAWEPARYLKYALPWGIHNYLLHPHPWVCLGAMAGCLGYAAVFFLLGYYLFGRRDL